MDDRLKALRKQQAEWVNAVTCYICGGGYTGEHRMEESPSGWYHSKCFAELIAADARRGPRS